MSDAPWAAPGVDCICINDKGWPDLRNGPFGIIIDLGNRPGPEFMQQYKIADVTFVSREDVGHRVKLHFTEYPDYVHCACQFRPLVDVPEETEESTTAPVDAKIGAS